MATVPWEFVIVHGGPGDTQPGGVPPGVSHRFAVPTGEVIPGLNMLLLRDDDPVILSVMSVTLTIQGEAHGTLGFQELDATGNWVTLALVLLTAAMAGARIDEESMLARRSITILVVRPLRIISL
ncbi:MAG: hypothetical protein AUF79_04375 [Crenarchaeota archaeon 13_1_20CM_2_51_8]|nr:MAG: hypothetical protein AUF79_04375 [Crenarchaeota archaeon 13_1_20CM_2_51_8]